MPRAKWPEGSSPLTDPISEALTGILHIPAMLLSELARNLQGNPACEMLVDLRATSRETGYCHSRSRFR